MDKVLQTMINNMPEKTGKSLEEWKAILKEKNFAKRKDIVDTSTCPRRRRLKKY